MNISKENLIRLMSLPKIGKSTIYNINSKFSEQLNSEDDLIYFMRDNYNISSKDFDFAFNKADEILLNTHKNNIEIISFQDELYPTKLLDLNNYPLILYYKGNIKSTIDLPGIAIIGTRNPSDYGYRFGMRISKYFALKGFNIISGLATGCDTSAHAGAILNNGITTAVLAGGLDKIYPSSNRILADDILEGGGLLLTEYPVGHKSYRNNFIERDRIQAALGLGVIVIESDINSGTMHTVRAAENINRLLAAVNYKDPQKQKFIKGNLDIINNNNAFSIMSKNDIDRFYEELVNNNNVIRNNISAKSQINLWDN